MSNGTTHPGGQALDELKLYLDAYKHHFEIFIKGALIYFGIIGAISSYIFREGINDLTKCALALFIIVISLITALGCWTSLKWLRTVRSRVHALQTTLSMAPFPFDGAKWVGRLMFIAALLFLIGGMAGFHGIRTGKLKMTNNGVEHTGVPRGGSPAAHP